MITNLKKLTIFIAYLAIALPILGMDPNTNNSNPIPVILSLSDPRAMCGVEDMQDESNSLAQRLSVPNSQQGSSLERNKRRKLTAADRILAARIAQADKNAAEEKGHNTLSLGMQPNSSNSAMPAIKGTSNPTLWKAQDQYFHCKEWVFDLLQNLNYLDLCRITRVNKIFNVQAKKLPLSIRPITKQENGKTVKVSVGQIWTEKVKAILSKGEPFNVAIGRIVALCQRYSNPINALRAIFSTYFHDVSENDRFFIENWDLGTLRYIENAKLKSRRANLAKLHAQKVTLEARQTELVRQNAFEFSTEKADLDKINKEYAELLESLLPLVHNFQPYAAAISILRVIGFTDNNLFRFPVPMLDLRRENDNAIAWLTDSGNDKRRFVQDSQLKEAVVSRLADIYTITEQQYINQRPYLSYSDIETIAITFAQQLQINLNSPLFAADARLTTETFEHDKLCIELFKNIINRFKLAAQGKLITGISKSNAYEKIDATRKIFREFMNRRIKAYIQLINPASKDAICVHLIYLAEEFSKISEWHFMKAYSQIASQFMEAAQTQFFDARTVLWLQQALEYIVPQIKHIREITMSEPMAEKRSDLYKKLYSAAKCHKNLARANPINRINHLKNADATFTEMLELYEDYFDGAFDVEDLNDFITTAIEVNIELAQEFASLNQQAEAQKHFMMAKKYFKHISAWRSDGLEAAVQKIRNAAQGLVIIYPAAKELVIKADIYAKYLAEWGKPIDSGQQYKEQETAHKAMLESIARNDSSADEPDGTDADVRSEIHNNGEESTKIKEEARPSIDPKED